jgi:hypothetical protein
VKGKLAPRYIRPFLILEKCGTMAYKLDLPPSLTGVHDIFHVLQLKKCLKAPVDVVLPEVTSLETDLSYPEHPTKILDQKDCVTRRKTIKFFKIQWSNHSKEEATWESKDLPPFSPSRLRVAMLENVRLFVVPVRTASPSKSQDEISIWGEGCDTPCL